MTAGGLPAQLATPVLRVSESGYYEWRGRPPSARALRHAWLTEQIQAVHVMSRGVYGARRIHAELTLGLGITAGRAAAGRLMRLAGINGLPGNRRRRPQHQTPTAPDLVDRQFTRPQPDQLWVTDITEHPTREGKVYCAVVLDAFSRRVVGWSIDSSQTAGLVTSTRSANCRPILSTSGTRSVRRAAPSAGSMRTPLPRWTGFSGTSSPAAGKTSVQRSARWMS
jgi:transposase InsO family protein